MTSCFATLPVLTPAQSCHEGDQELEYDQGHSNQNATHIGDNVEALVAQVSEPIVKPIRLANTKGQLVE